MKMIVAIIPPERLTAVEAALSRQQVSSMTVSEVLDRYTADITREIYRGREIRRPVTRLRLEVAVEDACFDATLETIERTGFSYPVRDGQLFVLELHERARLSSRVREAAACAV